MEKVSFDISCCKETIKTVKYKYWTYYWTYMSVKTGKGIGIDMKIIMLGAPGAGKGTQTNDR